MKTMALGMGPLLWAREFRRTHPYALLVGFGPWPVEAPNPRASLKRWPKNQCIAARRYYRALDRVNLGMVRP